MPVKDGECREEVEQLPSPCGSTAAEASADREALALAPSNKTVIEEVA